MMVLVNPGLTFVMAKKTALTVLTSLMNTVMFAQRRNLAAERLENVSLTAKGAIQSLIAMTNLTNLNVKVRLLRVSIHKKAVF